MTNYKLKEEQPDPDQVDVNRKITVAITYDLDTDECVIDSGFVNAGLTFKEPLEYTSHLIQMALEKWIREEIGMVCPNCSTEMDETWDWCPKCGYSLVEVDDEE